MKITEIELLDERVKACLVREMYDELYDRVDCTGQTPGERAQFCVSAKASIEMVCTLLPDFLSYQKIKKYKVIHG